MSIVEEMALSDLPVRVTITCDCGISISHDTTERAMALAIRTDVASVIAMSKAGKCPCKHLETWCKHPLISVVYL